MGECHWTQEYQCFLGADHPDPHRTWASDKIESLEVQLAEAERQLDSHKTWQKKLQHFGSMLIQPDEHNGHQLIGHRKFRDAFAYLIKEYMKDPSTLMAQGAQEERIQELERQLAEARTLVREERDDRDSALGHLNECASYLGIDLMTADIAGKVHGLTLAVRGIVEEARADGRRLEWMQERHASAEWGGFVTRRGGYDLNAVRMCWLENKPEPDEIFQSNFHGTLAAAIDAARAAEGGEGEGGG